MVQWFAFNALNISKDLPQAFLSKSQCCCSAGLVTGTTGGKDCNCCCCSHPDSIFILLLSEFKHFYFYPFPFYPSADGHHIRQSGGVEGGWSLCGSIYGFSRRIGILNVCKENIMETPKVKCYYSNPLYVFISFYMLWFLFWMDSSPLSTLRYSHVG